MQVSRNATTINDIREPSQFRGITFSKFKKTEVKKQFIENMFKGKIEQSCYWCAELICSGHFIDIWETLLYYISKYIHVGNPKLIIYLESRYNFFESILSKNNFTSELSLRNDDNIRKLFAEIIVVLCKSEKKCSFESVKINREEEFDMTQIPDRLKADNVEYIESIFLTDDPKELFIAMNEFAYHITKTKNMMEACYWIEWVIEFDVLCKKKKQKCECKKRSFPEVENKFQKDIIWIVWDILLYYVKQLNDRYIEAAMRSIMKLFCVKYTSGTAKKRRYMLYFAVALLTEKVSSPVELINDKEMLNNVLEKIGEVYKQIKKNEDSPKMDYLYNNLDSKHNLEVSLKKMELISSVDFINKK